MRRPAAALLGTLAGTVLLVGAKYASTSPAATAGDSAAAADGGATDAASGAPVDPSAAPGTPDASAGPAPSGPTPTASAAPGRGTPTPGRTTGGPPATTAAPLCTTMSGNAANVASPGIGAITVTIRVCGGVLKTATGAQSRSNWDTNATAVPALNPLAVRYYKTNFSMIHYSGATLTSTAYQASLRSAMTKSGI